jgi:methyl-accepting chemotaxis protein
MMDELVDSVRRVAEIMNEIASASHEQSSGIDQINKAITQMDTVVQMNASLVEEATAAATSMASQAAGLAQSVAQFRVADDFVAPAAAVAPPRTGRELQRASLSAERRPAPTHREPALPAAEGEEWKEF